jgi:CubicO group peptidase (beta-lactamase class C family)/poly-gamma-glutamate capsule biosynthesis protein CapA/YwtB (metallophosphatase superfamily)
MRRMGRTAAFTLLAVAATALLERAQSQDVAEPLWSLAATGDSIITRRIRVYKDEPFMRLMDIIRRADVAFTNLECQLFRFSEFKGYPAAEHGGGYELGPPEAAADLKWAGFDLLNRANNHTTDYGIEGMLETTRLLDAHGLVHAGTGMNSGEASQANYFDTDKGRFSLIGLATTFSPAARAGEARQEIRGRPGLNALRVERTYQLSPADMTHVRRVAGDLGLRVPAEPDQPLRFGRGVSFVAGPSTTLIEKVSARDEERILRNIRSAAKQSDFVIVSSHSHESGKTPDDPPPFLIEFIRKSIDAGATTYIVHGPHRLRGIEIYKGKPIFYSLGDFIFQYETTEPQAADIYESFNVADPRALAGELYERENQRGAYSLLAENAPWWESVVAVPVFRGHRVVEIELYPIELGHTRPPLSGDGRSQRGTPRLAQGQMGRKIIELVARLSAPFGTRITYQDGIGIWQLTPDPSTSSSISGAQPAAPTVSPPARQIDAELLALERNGFSGVVLWKKGRDAILAKGYGFADQEKKRPMALETVFDIGSITKPITAAAIWHLEAAGKLSVSDRLDRYFRNAPPDKAAITIDQLLTHQSGLDDLFGGDYDVVSRQWVLDKAFGSKLLFKPGERSRYSNSGYSILAMIIEDVSGKPYEQYVHENIFEPAGTPRIGYRIPKWSTEELAVGYQKGKRWGSPLDHPWAADGPSWNLRGNGGMLATADDLHTLMLALQDGPSLPEPVRQRFLGRYIRSVDGGPRRIRAIGGNGVFNADYIRWVDEDVTLIMMTNVDKFQGEEITPKLFDRVSGAK